MENRWDGAPSAYSHMSAVNGGVHARRHADVGAQWLSIAIAAERLSVTPGRVYHLIADGRLGTKTILSRLHVRTADVAAYRAYQKMLQNVRGRRALLYPGRAG